MKNSNRFRLSKVALCVAIALGTVPAFAQNTTSAIGGRVTASDGKPAAGATVKIVHLESGSTSNVVADADGRYTARGLRVGGPYTITITQGASVEKRENIYLALAETATLDAKFGTQVVDKIEVVARGGADTFNKASMGSGTSVSRQQLDAFASVQRNLQDYARNDPRVSQTDKERGEISAGGQNSRFNTLTIDGVKTNDTFGLEANGSPTAKQPISIDAIQSVQVNISNYDVTQQGYTGANINAITKSGTNNYKGSIYYVYRDERIAGKRYDSITETFKDPAAFEEKTFGITFGGPIVKDKLFFFASFEDQKSTKAVPAFGPLGSAFNNVNVTQSAIEGAAQIATSRYGFDVGSFQIPDGTKLSVRDALLKLDWNINDSHRASLRYSKINQSEPFYNGFSATGVSLSSNWFVQGKRVESTVAQWFADWTDTFSTEVKLSKRDFVSIPVNNSRLPAIGLQFSGALPANGVGTSTANRFLNFGTENSRHFNALDTETYDSYAAGNLILKDHEIKFGWDNSRNRIFNAFLQNTLGNYTFACVNSSATYTYSFGPITCGTATAAAVEAAVLENFRIGRPLNYQVQLPAVGGSLESGAGKWTLQNTGIFVQDTWTVNNNLSIVAGVRLDSPAVGDKPTFNAAAAAPTVAGSISPTTLVRATGGFGIDNSQTIDGQDLFQPRFGFNYSFDGAKQVQLRGGFGLFQGAAANVWLTNPYQNNGVATRVVGCGTLGFAACPTVGGTFSANPDTQPSSFAGATPAANVDFISSGLGQPSVWKANLAFDYEIMPTLVAGVEYLYTKTKQGIYYQHLNLGNSTLKGLDGRDLFYTSQAYNGACWSAGGALTTTGTTCTGARNRALGNASFANVLLADKTTKGGGNLVTVQLSRPLTKGWGWAVAYTRTDATEVSPLTSSVSNSNWAARSIVNPNEDVASNSAYLVRDRFNGNFNFEHSFFAGYKTRVGFTAEKRSGKPYSWTYRNDLNGDGSGGNDLMYIPKGPQSGEVVFLGDTATSRTNEDAFWAVVEGNKELNEARGGTVKRNGSFSPWSSSVDMRVSQEIPGFAKGNKASFTLDLLNVGNMLNKKWGRIEEMAFGSQGGATRNFVNFVGLAEGGKYIYSLNPVQQFLTRQAKGESAWSAQITMRYEF